MAEWTAPTHRPLIRTGEWSTARFETWIGATMFATIIIIQSLNVIGIVFEHTFGAYLLGLMLLLALASMHFVALLVAVHAATSMADNE